MAKEIVPIEKNCREFIKHCHHHPFLSAIEIGSKPPGHAVNVSQPALHNELHRWEIGMEEKKLIRFNVDVNSEKVKTSCKASTMGPIPISEPPKL